METKTKLVDHKHVGTRQSKTRVSKVGAKRGMLNHLGMRFSVGRGLRRAFLFLGGGSEPVVKARLEFPLQEAESLQGCGENGDARAKKRLDGV